MGHQEMCQGPSKYLPFYKKEHSRHASTPIVYNPFLFINNRHVINYKFNFLNDVTSQYHNSTPSTSFFTHYYSFTHAY